MYVKTDFRSEGLHLYITSAIPDAQMNKSGVLQN